MRKAEKDRIAQGFEMCAYIIKKKCTMNKVAEKFNTSITSARYRVEMVKDHDIALYKQAKKVQLEAAQKAQYEACRKGNMTRERKAEERHKLLASLNCTNEKEEECGANKRIRALRKTLKPGNIVTVFIKDKDEELESNKKVKNVEVEANVLGVYEHIVLLNLNGARESFTYDQVNRVIKH